MPSQPRRPKPALDKNSATDTTSAPENLTQRDTPTTDVGSLPRQETLFDALMVDAATTEADTARNAKKLKANGSSGHRQRLRERLDTGGSDAVPDYELLEMILFRAVARADTKPIAKRLLERFKTFAEVINAEPTLLKQVEGVGDRAVIELKLIRTSAQRLLKGEMLKRPILGSWQSVLDHCRAMHAYENKETFRILFLDKRNQLLADEVQGSGTVDHTPVYIREVIKRALELSSTSIILVHNHPSGDPSPSRADVDMTKMIVAAGKPLGVAVHDHIIVGRQGHASLRALGLM
jgi:DNA repair protein RadC